MTEPRMIGNAGDVCASAGERHRDDCTILDCGFHCAPPGHVESHECEGFAGKSNTVLTAEGNEARERAMAARGTN